MYHQKLKGGKEWRKGEKKEGREGEMEGGRKLVKSISYINVNEDKKNPVIFFQGRG
jgi:hypothetical protein